MNVYEGANIHSSDSKIETKTKSNVKIKIFCGKGTTINITFKRIDDNV